MKNILLISTSGRAAGAAVCRGGEVVRSKLSDNGLTHSETIMPLIDGLFDDEWMQYARTLARDPLRGCA